MFQEEQESIECIIEDNSNDLKREFDEDYSSNCLQEKAQEAFFNQKSKNGKAKVNRPVTKMYYGKKYVVGLISQQEQELSDEEEKPIHYYPPKLILLNFPRPHNYDAQKQLLLIENSQFQERMEEMNKQDKDLTTYLEQLIVGSSMNADEKNFCRKFWFLKFFDFALRYPPCCKRVKKFWEWVFMLNPQSNFCWRFKEFSLQWIELMTSYVEFRELFSVWFESFEQDISSELRDENTNTNEPQAEQQPSRAQLHQRKILFNTRLYGRYLKELLNMKNKSSITAEDVELREDMQDQVLGGGVILKPEGYKDSCICKRSEREIRIGMVPKLNKIKVKSNFKLFTKQNKQLNNLTDLFTCAPITPHQFKEDDDVDAEIDEGDDDIDDDEVDDEDDEEENEEFSGDQEFDDSNNKESEEENPMINNQNQITIVDDSIQNNHLNNEGKQEGAANNGKPYENGVNNKEKEKDD